jgi:hypothetical protein
VATSTSTTKIISIATTISTATSVAKAATGSTIRNTGEMRPMGIGKRRINSAVRVLLIVLVAELEIDPVLAEPEHVQVEVELEHDPVVAALVLQVVAELELVPVVVELEHAPVVVELELAQVVAEPERDPVVAEPELAPVVVVLAPNPPRAQLAVALKIKSVTAAHRRDLPLLVAVGLAAAAETTREPAAAEAVIAWAAVVIAVAVAPELAAVAEDAVAEE